MTSNPSSKLLPLESITQRIVLLRNQKVLLDSELAALYGAKTRRLNEQVRRNLGRFPADFIFEVTADEFAHLKSHFATSSWGGRCKLPLAFTEHGAIMAASVLNSQRAAEVSVYVVRAFVQLREALASHRDLAQKLEEQANDRSAVFTPRPLGAQYPRSIKTGVRRHSKIDGTTRTRQETVYRLRNNRTRRNQSQALIQPV